MPPTELPAALVRPRRRWNWAWLLPILAIGVAGPSAWQAWHVTGPRIVIHFPTGHGLRVNDTLRYHGIVVGEVRAVTLDSDLDTVRVELQIQQDAAALAHEGSLFWIVHPQIGWGGIAGLDTLAGARYIDVIGGSGPAQDEFTGLAETPIAALCPPGSLEVVLQAPTRGGIRPGSPVNYRQVTIGRVISTALAGDGGAVDLRLSIDPPYTALVKSRSIFWQDSGITFRLGFKEGLHVGFDSMETLLSGGIAMATPPEGGEGVSTGHRFELRPEAQDEWLKWQPAVALGPSIGGAQLPHPLATTLDFHYRELLMPRTRIRHGWTIPIAGGVLGPTDLLHAENASKGRPVELQIGGGRYPLQQGPVFDDRGLALLHLDLPTRSDVVTWPRSRMRSPHTPEDCLLIGDPGGEPMAIDQRRLATASDGWLPDRSLSIDRSWHGAAVVSRSDGCLIGILLIENARPRIAVLPDLQRLPSMGAETTSAPASP